jgi:hypothetical protein
VSDTNERDEQASPPSFLDVFFYAPVDAAFSLLADPRAAASRGRARVDEILRHARALGELSVRFGSRELRRRTEGAAAESGPSSTPPRPGAGPAPNDVIADYDALSASQIVPLLAGLDAGERGRIADYEAKARARQTILRRLAQLDAASG